MVGSGIDIARFDDKRLKHKGCGILKQKVMVLRTGVNELRKVRKMRVKNLSSSLSPFLTCILTFTLAFALTLILVLNLSAPSLFNRWKLGTEWKIV